MLYIKRQSLQYIMELICLKSPLVYCILRFCIIIQSFWILCGIPRAGKFTLLFQMQIMKRSCVELPMRENLHYVKIEMQDGTQFEDILRSLYQNKHYRPNMSMTLQTYSKTTLEILITYMESVVFCYTWHRILKPNVPFPVCPFWVMSFWLSTLVMMLCDYCWVLEGSWLLLY